MFIAEGVVQNHVNVCEVFEEFSKLAGNSGSIDLRESAATTTPPPPELVEAMTLSLQSLTSLFGLVQGDDILADILEQVVDKPSLASIALSLGVKAVLKPRYASSELLNAPPPGFPVDGPSRILPLHLDLNGRPALGVHLLVTTPNPPWLMTGGILAFEAQHPTQSRRITAKLIGSTRR